MRYIINDDDLEDWYQRIKLSHEFGDESANQLEYVLGEIKDCIDHPTIVKEDKIKDLEAQLKQQCFNNKHNLSIDQTIADKIKQLETENNRLKTLLFHFTGKME